MKIINYILYTLLICLAIIIEATFFSNIKLFGGMADLVLVILVSLTFFLKREDLLLAFIIAGVLMDLYIGQMIGSHILAFGIILLLINRYSKRMIRENIVIALLIIFLSSIIYYLVMGVLLLFVGKGYYVNLIFIKNALFSSIYNLLLGLIIYPITYLIFHRINKEIQ